ncbi:hypothetical protein B0H13DRAFT_1910776 [Mycena leptocephala]|nr:hypothetical protein B0H13DRAFT_1910776 [Mycena leptocephala]
MSRLTTVDSDSELLGAVHDIVVPLSSIRPPIYPYRTTSGPLRVRVDGQYPQSYSFHMRTVRLPKRKALELDPFTVSAFSFLPDASLTILFRRERPEDGDDSYSLVVFDWIEKRPAADARFGLWGIGYSTGSRTSSTSNGRRFKFDSGGSYHGRGSFGFWGYVFVGVLGVFFGFWGTFEYVARVYELKARAENEHLRMAERERRRFFFLS